jgi:hypothetical protein
MGASPRGIHYPEGTDLPDVPFDMEKMSQSIEDRSSIPVVANVADISAPYDYMVVMETATRQMKVYRNGVGWTGIGTAYVTTASDFPGGVGSIGYETDTNMVVVNTSGGKQTIPTGVRIYIGGSGYTPGGTRRRNDILLRYK